MAATKGPPAVFGQRVQGENQEMRRRDAARIGCDALLRAHLRAGQHLLTHALAIKLGATLGMAACDVRAAPGDPTIRAGA